MFTRIENIGLRLLMHLEAQFGFDVYAHDVCTFVDYLKLIECVPLATSTGCLIDAPCVDSVAIEVPHCFVFWY